LNGVKLQKIIRAFGNRRDFRLMTHGIAPSLEHSKVLRVLPSARTIVDIGANKGQFTLEAIKWHPDARVLAFEPQICEADKLRWALSNLQNLKVYSVALGDEDGQASLNISAHADSSSLLRQTSLQVTSFPGTGEISQEQVKVSRFDSIVDERCLCPPVICKIDVQGFELKVLKGFGHLINSIDFMIVELSSKSFYENSPNSSDVISFLSGHNFKINCIYDMYIKNGLCTQADFLFERWQL